MSPNRHLPANRSTFLFWTAARAWFATSIIAFVGMTLSDMFDIEFLGLGVFIITSIVAIAHNLSSLLRVQPSSIWYSTGLHLVFWPVAFFVFIFWTYMAACGQGYCF